MFPSDMFEKLQSIFKKMHPQFPLPRKGTTFTGTSKKFQAAWASFCEVINEEIRESKMKIMEAEQRDTERRIKNISENYQKRINSLISTNNWFFLVIIIQFVLLFLFLIFTA